eukprot:926684-Prymnesium_polylepis.1
MIAAGLMAGACYRQPATCVKASARRLPRCAAVQKYRCAVLIPALIVVAAGVVLAVPSRARYTCLLYTSPSPRDAHES